jgi:exonuclease-1
MGVDGLLPFLKSAVQEVHLEQYRGRRVAIDASCWLHRGAISCARELATGVPTDSFLRYPKRMIALCRTHAVEPVLVFDGAPAPMKARTDAARSKCREMAKQAGDWARAVRITHSMVHQFIEWLRRDGTAFFVAPFEADAQVVHLVLCGYCAAVISEDSDLLAYRCPAVLYKLSPETGHGKLITWDGLRTAQDSKGVLLFDGKWAGEWEAWEAGLFASMCILAGCDYLPSFPGVGTATAHKLLRSSRSVERAIARLQDKIKGQPPSEPQLAAYLLQLRRCQEIFDHARVWDPTAGRLIHLRPLPAHTASDGEEFDYLGPPMSPEIAREVCCDATRDPVTLQPILRAQATSLRLPQFEAEDALQLSMLTASPVAQGEDDASDPLDAVDMPLDAPKVSCGHLVTSRHFLSSSARQSDPWPSTSTRAGPSPVKRGLADDAPERKAARGSSPGPFTSEAASRRSASARQGVGLLLPLSLPPLVDNSFLQAFRHQGRV